MRFSFSSIVIAAVAAAMGSSSVDGFSVGMTSPAKASCVSPLAMSTMADSGVPPATSESSDVPDVENIPTNLPSDCGMDYIPLATMLATGQLAEADQVRVP